MSKQVLVNFPSGVSVYVNLLQTAAGKTISRQPYLIKFIKEALLTKDITGPSLYIEHDMGRVIGHTDIIETSEKDIIFYAQPFKKTVFSRYAKNRFPTPSNHITVLLEQDSEGDYEVTNTWIGTYSPPFPGDLNETDQSKSYWENHAYVQDAELVKSKSITKTSPY
ncbi:MAG: hypothetical protein NVSMB46_05970 [Candidatus Saccharimonadales bacterium]